MNNTLLREVLSEIETNITKLQTAKSVIEAMLNGDQLPTDTPTSRKGTRQMSASSRRKIGQAAKKRWAARRKAAKAANKSAPAKAVATK